MWATKRAGTPMDGGPQKKIVVQGLTALPTLPPSYKTDTLERLRTAVRAIQQNQPTAQGLEELYRDCEGLCLHKFGSDVYEMLRHELEKCARESLARIDGQMGSVQSGEESVLGQIRRFWEGYTQQLGMIKCIFLYLDRTYALQTANVVSLWAMGLAVVQQYLVDTQMRARLVRLFISEVTAERDGRTVDDVSLASMTGMFVDLDQYSQFLLPKFIDATRQYYQKEGLRMVSALRPVAGPAGMQVAEGSASSMDVPGYLAHVQRRLDEEARRTARYLTPDTRSTLLATVQAELVEAHAGKLLESSLDAMIDGNMVSDLKAFYGLLVPVNKVDMLRRSWNGYIKKTGKQMMQVPDLDVSLITGLLELKRKLDAIVREAFEDNGTLISSMREAFEAFVNTRRSKPAQLLARYVDQCMRMGSRLGSEEEVDDLLSRIVILFRFISGKDLFEAYYRRDLAKRLVYGKSGSVDIERQLLLKLRVECGSAYTKRLEGMISDMDASDELAAMVAQVRQEQPGAAEVGFKASVLTMAYWPTYEPLGLVLPEQVEKVHDKFTEVYSQKYRGRNLQWQHNLGTCLIRVQFEEGAKELQMSHVQGAVLLLFDEASELDYAQIQQNTGLEDAELQRALQSLACGKYRVLTKEPKGPNVGAGDKFAFNADFKCPQVRVKIGQIAIKEIEKESKEIEETIQVDRMYRVDAAIARVMKARKTLEHGALVTELMGQVNFNVAAAEIKERIEVMLDRDYIQRDDADTSTYHYVA
ncbi:Cullin-4A [Coemansia sp. RSA 552]|nr:Cullin-4A [Coemansia sp. RSA 552]